MASGRRHPLATAPSPQRPTDPPPTAHPHPHPHPYPQPEIEGNTEWEKSAISHVYIHIYSFLKGGAALNVWAALRAWDGTNIHEQNAVCSSPVARLRQNLHKFGI